MWASVRAPCTQVGGPSTWHTPSGLILHGCPVTASKRAQGRMERAWAAAADVSYAWDSAAYESARCACPALPLGPALRAGHGHHVRSGPARDGGGCRNGCAGPGRPVHGASAACGRSMTLATPGPGRTTGRSRYGCARTARADRPHLRRGPVGRPRLSGLDARRFWTAPSSACRSGSPGAAPSLPPGIESRIEDGDSRGDHNGAYSTPTSATGTPPAHTPTQRWAHLVRQRSSSPHEVADAVAGAIAE